MNYGALILVAAGGGAIFVAIKGTQGAVWQAITGQKPTSAPPISSLPNSVVVNGVGSTGYAGIAMKDAQAAGINATYFVRQINQESGFNPAARSGAGAEGIAQFMPGTAAGLGINPWDPIQALSAAAKLMAGYIKQFGSEAAALAAYNAGSGTVQYAMQRGGANWESYLPAETQNYIRTIMG